MITKLNLTLVCGKLDSFFLVDRMGTFQNSITHLQQQQQHPQHSTYTSLLLVNFRVQHPLRWVHQRYSEKIMWIVFGDCYSWIFTGPIDSNWQYQRPECLELHHPISHLLKVSCLDQSVPLSPSCVLVTVGF